MADHTPVNLPDELEALLRETMAVEPSPQFAVRVRQRIELEPRKTRWSWTWFIAAGAAAVLVLAVVLPMRFNEGGLPPAPPLAPPVQVEAAPVPPARPTSPINSERARVEAPRVPRVVASHDPRRFEFPTVIVDPRQRAALNALARLSAQGQVSEEILEKLAAAPASVPAPIAVEPLVVSPIGLGGVLHFEIERR